MSNREKIVSLYESNMQLVITYLPCGIILAKIVTFYMVKLFFVKSPLIVLHPNPIFMHTSPA